MTIRPNGAVGSAGFPLAAAGEDSHRPAQTRAARPSSVTLRPLEGEYSFAAVSSSRSASSASPVLLVLDTAGGRDLRNRRRRRPLGGFVFTAVPPAVWILTALGFVAIVVLDLVVIARRKSAVTMRQATLWVIFYVALAALFAVGLFVFRSGTSGSEFVAGYITEYSLSVDNLFVFIIIMARFAVPPAGRRQGALHRHRRVDAAARGLHRGRCRGHRRRQLGLLLLRRVPDLHRRQAGPRGRERRGGLPGERRAARAPAGRCR